MKIKNSETLSSLRPDEQRLIDQVCERYENSWTANSWESLEPALQTAPPPLRPILLHELLKIDAEIRARNSVPAAPQEHLRSLLERAGVQQSLIATASICQTAGAGDDSGNSNDYSYEFVAGQSFDKFRLVRPLGHGTFGEVYLAQDANLGREVAIKILRRQWLEHPAEAERFSREARLAAAVQHRHLCPVYELGKVASRQYIVMAWLSGSSLQSRIRQAQPTLPFSETSELIQKIAAGLEAAHQGGLIHRDLKPANILFDAEGEPVITDFGLATRAAIEEARLTATGAIIGSPAYMSPEQARGAEFGATTAASDVYSLGVIFYEMLTGRPPFLGSAVEVLAAHIRDQPEPPSRHNRQVSAALDAVCLRALAKLPADRFATAAEFAAAIPRSMEIPAHPAASALKSGKKQTRRVVLLAATFLGCLVAALGLPSLFNSPEITKDARNHLAIVPLERASEPPPRRDKYSPQEFVRARAEAERVWKRNGGIKIGATMYFRPVRMDESSLVTAVDFSGLPQVSNQDLRGLDAFPDLIELRVGGTGIDVEGLRQLSRFSRLQKLDVQGLNLVPAAGKILADLPALQEVTVGDPNSNTLEFVKAVAASNSLRSIEFCDLPQPPSDPRVSIYILAHQLDSLRAEIEVTARLNRLDSINYYEEFRHIPLAHNRRVRLISPPNLQPKRDLEFATWARSGEIPFEWAPVDNSGVYKSTTEPIIPFKIISVEGSSLDDERVEKLAGLNYIRHLQLNESRITDRSAKVLGSLNALRDLHLADTALTDEAVAELRNLNQLGGLYLDGTEVTEQGLGSCLPFERIQLLGIPSGACNPNGLKLLQKCPVLRCLRVSGPNVSEEFLTGAFETLQLNELRVADTAVTAETWQSLQHSQIKVLIIEKVRISQSDLQALAKHSKLEKLSFVTCSLEFTSLTPLRESSALQALTFHGSDITAEQLSGIESSPQLRTLNITSASVGDAHIPQLARASQLKQLELGGTRITATGRATLKQMLPECEFLMP